MRTGEFARASSLSVKALRVYHDRGLLVPSVVDPDTGYSAYSPAQLSDAAIIRMLREVGVSLQDIHAVLVARDLGLVRKVLAEQAVRFQVGLDAVARLVDDLDLDGLDDVCDVTLRSEAERSVLALRGSPSMAELERFVYRSETTLREAAVATGAVIDGCFGGCYPPQVDEDKQEVIAFIPIATPVLVPSEFSRVEVRVDELPACQVAVLVLRGPYSGLDTCYRRLGAWVAFHAAPGEHPVRELYLTPLAGPQDEAVTELLWPIIAGSFRE